MKLFSGRAAKQLTHLAVLMLYTTSVCPVCAGPLPADDVGCTHASTDRGETEGAGFVLAGLDVPAIAHFAFSQLMASSAAHVTGVFLGAAAHKVEHLLASIDLDKMADDARRKIEGKIGPVDDNTIYMIGLAVAAGILGAGLLMSVVMHVGLPALGFTAEGVAAGSIAAAWQSTLGDVAAGSLFAMLQSITAGALGGSLVAGAAAVGGISAAAYSLRE